MEWLLTDCRDATSFVTCLGDTGVYNLGVNMIIESAKHYLRRIAAKGRIVKLDSKHPLAVPTVQKIELDEMKTSAVRQLWDGGRVGA